jgi:hypothetical protein
MAVLQNDYSDNLIDYVDKIKGIKVILVNNINYEISVLLNID